MIALLIAPSPPPPPTSHLPPLPLLVSLPAPAPTAASAPLYELECLIGLLLNPYYFCSPATPVICLFRPPPVQFDAP